MILQLGPFANPPANSLPFALAKTLTVRARAWEFNFLTFSAGWLGSYAVMTDTYCVIGSYFSRYYGYAATCFFEIDSPRPIACSSKHDPENEPR